MHSVYTDILLRKLKDSGIGCYIGPMYVGGLTYADDLMLLCPSIRRIEFDVNYKQKNTIYQTFTTTNDFPARQLSTQTLLEIYQLDFISY